jgi:hypothetical protein
LARFRDHALDLQQQIVLGRAADRPIEEHDLGAGAPEFLNQQNLVGIAPRQPIRSQNVDPVEAASGDRVTQAFERRPNQSRAAISLIDERMVRLQPNPVRPRAISQ